MINTWEESREQDLETIIAIQRVSFKAVYAKYYEYDPYLEDGKNQMEIEERAP